jgi:hypothetical protein
MTRGRTWRIVIVLAVCALVVTVGVLSYVIAFAKQPGATYPAPPTNWVTYRAAWSDVSDAFSAFANDGWSVSFAEGVAADGHWSPPAYLWALYGPGGWTSCEAQLNGVSTLTFWNATTYPASSSPNVFTSGAAPLWTFVFNGSSTPTFVTSWFLGRVILNAALMPGNPCLQLPIFNASKGSAINPSHELDSSVVASEVQAEDQYLAQNPIPPGGGFAPMPVPPTPGVALYLPGLELLPSTIGGAGSWTVAYTQCGLIGTYGQIAPFVAYLLNATVTSQSHSFQWFSSRPPCFDSEYYVTFNKTATIGAPSNVSQYFTWTANVTFMTSAVPARWSLDALSTSLFGLQLTSDNPPFNSFESAAELCGPGSQNLTSCPPPAQGWYAVLSSPSGKWLDSYPTTQNGSDWAVPDVSLESGDHVVFVGSNYSWGSTDSLGLATTNEPWIVGGGFL